MSDNRRSLRINRLAFTGPDRELVSLAYTDGLNIIWGASNHGKSFSAESINFMLGAKGPLEVPEEGNGLDSCVLWATVDDQAITFQRAVAGGKIAMAEGHFDEVRDGQPGYRVLNEKHTAGSESVSSYLLTRLGFRDAQLLKNERANKTAFTFRKLMRYIYIDEDRIFSKKSVALQEGRKLTAEDNSLLKFIATGIDGSSIVTVATSGEQKAAQRAKIEMLQELADERAPNVDDDRTDEELSRALSAASETRDLREVAVRDRQATIEKSRDALNRMSGELRDFEASASDLRAMRFRFTELQRTFHSDIQRLVGLEEGSFLLGKFTKMNCPLCGAHPEHQHKDDHLERAEAQRLAIEVEISKIKAELEELEVALADVVTEIEQVEEQVLELRETIGEERIKLEALYRGDREIKTQFLEANETVRALEAEIARRQYVSQLQSRIASLAETKIDGRPRAENLNASISNAEAFQIAQTVKRVLDAWGYQGGSSVSFDLATHDLMINGKERRGNGKGVRALLHSAFQVAMLIFCYENNRPHPGLLILDTPLLAYREPEENEVKEDDDKELASSGIDSRFYKHLHSLADIGQFIVIENSTPPGSLPGVVHQVHYDGGSGLF